MKMMYRRIGQIVLCFSCWLSCLVAVQAQSQVHDLQERLNRAKQLFENDMYQSAEKELTTLLELCPVEGLSQCELEGYRLLCRILLERPNIDGLVVEFEEQYPYSPELARIYFFQSCYYFQKEDYAKSLEVMAKIENAYLRKSERIQFMFNRAYCDLRIGNYDRSEAGFEKILTFDQNEFTQPSTYYLAYVHYVERNFAQAVPLFEKLQQHARFGIMSRYFLVESKLMMKDYDFVVEQGPALYEVVGEDYQPRLARIISEAYYELQDAKQAKHYLSLYEESGGKMSRRDNYYAGILSFSLGGYHAAADSFTKVVGTKDSIGQSAGYYLGNAYLQLKNKHSAIDAFRTAADSNFDRALREDAFFQYAKLMFDVNNDISPFLAYLEEYPSSNRSDEIHAYIATSYLLAKDYRPALESLSQIRNLTPEMSANYQKAAYFRGIQLYERGAFRSASESFDLSLKHAQYNAALKQLTRFWLAESLYRMDDYNKSLEINLSLIQDPLFVKTKEYPAAVYNLAYDHFALGQYDKAALYYKQYLDFAPSKRVFTVDAQTRLADSYFMLRDYERAAELYEQVAGSTFSRGNLYPRYQGALAYGLLSDYDKKIELLKDITDLSPNSPIYPMALYELGRTYVQTGKNDKARSCYNLLMGQVRDSVYYTKAMLEMGLIASNENKNKEALGYFSTLVEQYPLSEESSSALAGIESIYQRTNKPEEYLAYLERIGMSSLKSAGEKEQMFFNAAEQQFLAGNYQEAMTSLRRYLKDYPQGARVSQAYFYLAECLKAAGSLEAAADAYHQVMLIGDASFSELATLNYAALCMKLEKYEEAVLAYETLSRIARLDNNLALADEGRMRAYFRSGNYAKALHFAEQVLRNAPTEAVDLRREADYLKAKSLLALGEREQAKKQLAALAVNSMLPEGAEAAYLLVQDAYDEGNFELVEERVYALSDTGTPQTYWLAKAFIVLGDSFAEREEWEQAEATFRSILEEYQPAGDHDDILEQVKMRVDRLPISAPVNE